MKLHGLEVKECDDEICCCCPEKREMSHGHNIRDDKEEEYRSFPDSRRGEESIQVLFSEDMEGLFPPAPFCGGAEEEQAQKDEHSSQYERKQPGGDENGVVEYPHPQGSDGERRPEDDQANGGDVVRPGTLVHSSCHVIRSA